MRGRFSQGDVLAGGAAVAALLLLVFVLGANQWLAIALAIATYAGVTLLRPQTGQRSGETAGNTTRPDVAYQTALTKAAEIRALEPRIAKPAIRAQVGRICDQTDRILAAIREDGNLAAAALYNEQLLLPADAFLRQYVHVSTREVRSAGELLKRIETQDLPLIEQAGLAFYEKLHRANVVDLATLAEVLEFNLEGLTPPPAQVQEQAEITPTSPPVDDVPVPAEPLVADTSVYPAAAQFGLTARELEILPLLAQRLTDREIAERLCISPRTAMNHASSILGKLGLSSRRELADFAKEHGLEPPALPPHTGK